MSHHIETRQERDDRLNDDCLYLMKSYPQHISKINRLFAPCYRRNADLVAIYAHINAVVLSWPPKELP